jgi:hypothetical protein
MMYGKSQARGEGRVKMNHLRTVQTRNVVVSNVMMSSAPKMTCPHTHRFRVFMPGNTTNIYKQTISIVDVAEIFSRFAANKQAQSMREGGSVFSRVWADNTPCPAHHTQGLAYLRYSRGSLQTSRHRACAREGAFFRGFGRTTHRALHTTRKG